MTSTPEPVQRVALIAEDEPLLRRLTGQMLRALGYEVREAADGFEAERVLRETPAIEVVLLDLLMPGRTAGETLTALRAARPGLDVIVCSGFGADDVGAFLVGQPRVWTLQKPFTRAQLGEALARRAAPPVTP
jgi:CheY-like chemotaxis protein